MIFTVTAEVRKEPKMFNSIDKLAAICQINKEKDKKP
jgi:hypothetical protein